MYGNERDPEDRKPEAEAPGTRQQDQAARDKDDSDAQEAPSPTIRDWASL